MRTSYIGEGGIYIPPVTERYTTTTTTTAVAMERY